MPDNARAGVGQVLVGAVSLRDGLLRDTKGHGDLGPRRTTSTGLGDYTLNRQLGRVAHGRQVVERLEMRFDALPGANDVPHPFHGWHGVIASFHHHATTIVDADSTVNRSCHARRFASGHSGANEATSSVRLGAAHSPEQAVDE